MDRGRRRRDRGGPAVARRLALVRRSGTLRRDSSPVWPAVTVRQLAARPGINPQDLVRSTFDRAVEREANSKSGNRNDSDRNARRDDLTGYGDPLRHPRCRP
jgi:hypothetical protein